MSDSIAFVYSKDGNIKVLNLENAKIYHDSLIEDGWKHTQTLNPHQYIEFLHNECQYSLKKFIIEMNELRDGLYAS